MSTRPNTRPATRPVAQPASRLRAFAFVPLALVALLAAGCRQDMHDAPRYEPLEKSTFYADDRASRDPIPGTIAREYPREITPFNTGMGADGRPLAELPVTLSPVLLARGQERYNIFCAPCHDQVGTGQGMIVRRGYKQPQTLHSDRLRAEPPGYFFDVISNGFGQMPSYASQVPTADRWAIAAYIRALQLSQNAPRTALSAADLEALEAAGEAATTGATMPAGDANGHAAQGEHR